LEAFIKTSNPEEAKEILKSMTRSNSMEKDGWDDNENQFYLAEDTYQSIFEQKAVMKVIPSYLKQFVIPAKGQNLNDKED